MTIFVLLDFFSRWEMCEVALFCYQRKRSCPKMHDFSSLTLFGKKFVIFHFNLYVSFTIFSHRWNVVSTWKRTLIERFFFSTT